MGSHLVDQLVLSGHEVIVASRNSALALENLPYTVLLWPAQSPAEIEIVQSCDAVINLAGESIAGARWTDEQKLNIRKSRIELTRDLVSHLAGSQQLKVFLSSSAIGFYGHRKSEVLTEESPVGEGFLAEVCRDWERVALELKNSSVRKVLLRTGVVLHRDSGFLKELEPIYQNWVGGPVGGGDQFISWIHLQDWVNAVLFCLENSSVQGPVNLVAPEPVSNRAFSHEFAKLFRQPWQLPVPSLALKVSLGEMSQIALDSQNVRPIVLQKNGFRFQFSNMRDALENLYDINDRNRHVSYVVNSRFWLKAPHEKVLAYLANEKVKAQAEMSSDSDNENNWDLSQKVTPATNGWLLVEEKINYKLGLGALGRLVSFKSTRQKLVKMMSQRSDQLRREFKSLQ